MKSEPVVGSIFIDGLSFDYAHFLEWHPLCSRLHGHTSNVRLTIIGEYARHGMLVDFSELKGILKKVLDRFDHRLIVDRRHAEVVSEAVIVCASRPSGETMRLILPPSDVVLLDAEATIENITDAVMQDLRREFDRRIAGLVSVQLQCTEATFKGAVSGYAVDPRR